jgi:iron(III) transport system substrate-binding protein
MRHTSELFSVIRAIVLLIGVIALSACQRAGEAPVVVYTSVDDVFARPLAELFQKRTGTEVRLVTDTEETKSTGLLNRLLAEKTRPQADVFWSGDPVRAAVLKRQGVSQPYRPADPADARGQYSDPQGHWSALSARARVVLYNTDAVRPEDATGKLESFLDPKWKGRACLANPLFGTTSMHAAALFDTMGEEPAKAFFTALRENEVKMLSSNGEVKRQVASGACVFGLTDTDDAHVAIQEGKPVVMRYADANGGGTLVVPNAAVLISGAPNPDGGRRFIDFLMSPEAEQALAASPAAQMPLRPGVSVPQGVDHVTDIRAMPVEYERLAAHLESLSRGWLKEWADAMAR